MSTVHPKFAAACAGIVAFGPAGSGWAVSGNVLLIQRDQPVQSVEVAEISPGRLVYRDAGGDWLRVPLEACVALLDADAVILPRHQGWLRLVDGQRFPGEALSGAKVDDGVLAWNQSSWLGRMEVPLDRIASVAFTTGASVPEAGDADVLLLSNGDRLDGFVTALGDPVVLELLNGAGDGAATIELPLGRVAAVRMVTPPRKPSGRRLWLIDGTVVDVPEITLAEDGVVRLRNLPFVADQQPKRVELSTVVAVLFDPDGLIPFAAMKPHRVEGPPTRYIVPHPRVLDDMAPLGLARVEFRGPVSVRYVLPSGSSFFSAEAELPVQARSWGNFDLVIRDGDREIFSGRLDADNRRATIGAPLSGSTLTIEITEGSAGPIQDHVVLVNAFVLKD